MGESFCFLVAGPTTVVLGRHTKDTMSKRVVLCYSKMPHRELEPFVTELCFSEGIVSGVEERAANEGRSGG